MILTGILYLKFQKKSVFGVFGCFSYVLALGGGVLGQDILNLLCFSMKSGFFAKF